MSGHDEFAVSPSRTSNMETLQAFLYAEADCADEHRYDDWLSMWDEEGELLYWIPAGRDDIDPRNMISFVYDNRSRLEDRIHRLKSHSAHAQRPKSRMRRVVSNVVIDGDDGTVVIAHANFILAELRQGRQDVFNGRFVYTLRRAGGGLKMKSKKVILINNDEFIDNLSFIL